jgi:hypothetical protein
VESLRQRRAGTPGRRVVAWLADQYARNPIA